MPDENGEQVFLAAATDMVLTRFVELEGGRTRSSRRMRSSASSSSPPFRSDLLHGRPSRSRLPGRGQQDPGCRGAAGYRGIRPGQDQEGGHQRVTPLPCRPCRRALPGGVGRAGGPVVQRTEVPEGGLARPEATIDALTPVEGRGPRLVVLHLCETDNGIPTRTSNGWPRSSSESGSPPCSRSSTRCRPWGRPDPVWISTTTWPAACRWVKRCRTAVIGSMTADS